MPLKTRKPITPGQRGLVLQTTDDITRRKPKKNLVKPIKKTGGRNSSGRMTVRHRGGGHKRRYRVIDFKRDNYDILGTVETIEYDPNRTAHIALITYTDKEKAYIISPQGLKQGDVIESGKNVEKCGRRPHPQRLGGGLRPPPSLSDTFHNLFPDFPQDMFSF